MTTSRNKDTNDMDGIIGRRIRLCRQSHKMSQTKLANQVGIAWQQIQKYEGGKNRVSATMLWKIADVFDVSLSYFFENISDELGVEDAQIISMKWREDRLVELYSQLDEEQKKSVFNYVKSVCADEKVYEVAE